MGVGRTPIMQVMQNWSPVDQIAESEDVGRHRHRSSNGLSQSSDACIGALLSDPPGEVAPAAHTTISDPFLSEEEVASLHGDMAASTLEQLVGEPVEFIRLVHMLDDADEEAGCPVDGVPKEADLRAKLPLERAVPTQDKLENDVEDEDDYFYRFFSIFFEMLCTTGKA